MDTYGKFGIFQTGADGKPVFTGIHSDDKHELTRQSAAMRDWAIEARRVPYRYVVRAITAEDLRNYEANRPPKTMVHRAP